MLTKQKNKERKQIFYLDSYLIPVTAITLSKKIEIKKETEGSSMDFHLEIIKKIDKLLNNNESKKNSYDLILDKQLKNNQEDSFIELRSSLNKNITYPEHTLDRKPNHFFPKIESSHEITPEQVRTKYPISNYHIKENVRIEIIDVGNKSIKDETNKKTSIFSIHKLQKIKSKFNQKTKQNIIPRNIQSEKVVVIDTKELGDKKSEKLWNNILKKPNKNEKKAKLFYINSQQQQKESKSDETSSDELYIPKNFGKKLQIIKENDNLETEKRKKKNVKKRQKEENKLQKLEAKKALLEVKEKEKLAKIKEKEKTKNLVTDKNKKQSQDQETSTQKPITPKKSASDVEKLTEWESYDAEIEDSHKSLNLNKNEQEKQQNLIQKKKQMELKQQEKEKRIKEKEDKKNKKLEAKKTLKEEKEKQKLARIEEKEKKKNLLVEEKKKKSQERELEKANKNLTKKQKLQKKEKKPLQLFRKEKKKIEENKIPIESKQETLGNEQQISEIKQDPKKEEFKEKINQPEQTFLDEDIKKLLIITDDLLSKLPDEVIDEFAKSEDFKLYSKVFNKYKLK
jgi:hypothetical protein